MAEYELTISKRINHFNSKHWFEVIELESGEELGDDFDTFEEAEHFLRNMVKEGAGKYFTKLKLASGFAYRLKRLKSDSDRLGNCEVCEKHVDTMYLLTEMKRYWNHRNKSEGLTHAHCSPGVYGHKECLSKETDKGFLAQSL